jgi:hypothetical protein
MPLPAQVFLRASRCCLKMFVCRLPCLSRKSPFFLLAFPVLSVQIHPADRQQPASWGTRIRGEPHFDTEIDTPACNFVPRTDGFGGFFLREDVTQALEPILHDSTEGKYNIDMIKSDFSFTRKPPCETNFIEMRYLYMRQNFMSQDQLTGIMLGLAFIKRYVSATDSVTTCDGRKFSVLSPAQRLARSYINNMDDGDSSLITIP